MAENSAIEWTDHTFNPWIGCTKVGPGCDHCYAEVLATTRLAVAWGPYAERRRTASSTWALPRRWDRKAAAAGIRQRVFCASLADVFDNAVPAEWRADLFALIRDTPHLDWLLVTKRIGNAGAMAQAAGGWPTNVWLGATIVDQREADRDIPKLLAIRGPRFRFLSMEPLLGPVDLTMLHYDGITNVNALTGAHGLTMSGRGTALDWVIVGGESGTDARPMHPTWARELRDQCKAAGVPFLFKQWGELAYEPLADVAYEHVSCIGHDGGAFAYSADPLERAPMPRAILDERDQFWREVDAPPAGAVWWRRVGKKAAGRLLDGVTHDGAPA